MGAVAVELTVAAEVVAPLACDTWSTAVRSATVESPEYSRAMMAISPAADGFAVMVGLLPPVITGAVHTLISVPSEAVKCVTSTKGSPDESLTALVVALADFHTPTSTTRRFPAVTLVPGTTEMLLLPDPWALTCWTNAGLAGAAASAACAVVNAGPAARPGTATTVGAAATAGAPATARVPPPRSTTADAPAHRRRPAVHQPGRLAAARDENMR